MKVAKINCLQKLTGLQYFLFHFNRSVFDIFNCSDFIWDFGKPFPLHFVEMFQRIWGKNWVNKDHFVIGNDYLISR